MDRIWEKNAYSLERLTSNPWSRHSVWNESSSRAKKNNHRIHEIDIFTNIYHKFKPFMDGWIYCTSPFWIHMGNMISRFHILLPSGRLTWQWKTTIFDGRYIFLHGRFPIAMLVLRGVFVRILWLPQPGPRSRQLWGNSFLASKCPQKGILAHRTSSDDDAWGVLHHLNEAHRSLRFHETLLSFGEPGSLGCVSKEFFHFAWLIYSNIYMHIYIWHAFSVEIMSHPIFVVLFFCWESAVVSQKWHWL